MNQSSTTQRRILQSAEALYGSRGVAATSLRAIVKEANVNLNAVNYHFGTKDSVTAELFRSIMEPINQERKRLLEALSGSDPTTRQLMHAIYWPLYRRAVESEQSRRQIQIVNQIRQDPSPEARAWVQENLEDFVPRFESMMSAAASVSKSRLRIPIRLMIATAWGLVSQSIVIDDLAARRSKQTQKQVFEQFLDYTTSGFDSLIPQT